MIQNFKIDQARTFASLLLLAVEPKRAYGDEFQQETTKDGTPKWTAQIVAEFRAFGRPAREIINVGVVAASDPGEGLAPATPVELVDFEIGVMEKTNKAAQVIGVQVWYRCASIRATSSTERKGRQIEAVS